MTIDRKSQLIPGLLFFALAFLLAAANGWVRVIQQKSLPGFRTEKFDGRLLIATIRDSTPNSVLKTRDEVVAVNGQAVNDVYQLESMLRSLEPETQYSVLVRRNGQMFAAMLMTEGISPLLWMNLVVQYLILPAVFLLTGLAVFLLRRNDKQALLLALLFGTMPGIFSLGYYADTPAWLSVLLWIAALPGVFLPPLFLHFFLIFPEEPGQISPLLRRFPRFEKLLYLPHVLIGLPMVIVTGIAWLKSSVIVEQYFQRYYLQQTMLVIDALCFVGGLVSLVVNYHRASSSSRRRMRVVVIGSLVGVVPLLLLFGTLYFYGLPPISTTAYRLLVTAITFAFLMFPLSFAYAIIRHRVIPVSFILRRGVRYLFVSQGSLVIEIIAVALGVNLLLWGILKYVGTLNVWLVGVLSAIDAILVWNLTSELHRRVIAPAIDRQFFREAYNAQQVLAELGQSLRTMTDCERMTMLAAERIQAALHTENVVIFLRDERTGDYAVNGSAWQREEVSADESIAINDTSNIARQLLLPRDAYTVTRFRESSQPLVFDLDDPQSWAYALLVPNASWNLVRQREGETLRQIRPALMLPILAKDKLLGIISLGPRLGDLPFSREDRHLLMNVALQIAYAIENSQLVQRRVEEERLRQELLMAAEVQQRLFPKCAPEMSSLELCGECRPARGVAGDYYDFIALDPGRVAIAVADVAGKGIAAALLMSTVQASLRSQAPISSGDPRELVGMMNQLLFDSTDTSSYATFFYAQYDELTRRICYVNAGHNPPLLLRANGSFTREPERVHSAVDTVRQSGILALELRTETERILNLDTGGPVIGLLEDCLYECETLPLESGDVLVAYTDGVTEAFNSAGEEFGEDRLRQVIESTAHLSASEISQTILQTIAAWCSNASQHDDQTLVVMKVR